MSSTRIFTNLVARVVSGKSSLLLGIADTPYDV
jgi:hypothetical protein